MSTKKGVRYTVSKPDKYLEIDEAFKSEIEKVLATLNEKEKVFVLQSLGLAHAIHSVPTLLQHGIDTYTAQIPASKNGSMYSCIRNATVWLRNKEAIVAAKEELAKKGIDNLRGIALSVDAHAVVEDKEGGFDRFFPSVEQLRKLGITKVLFFDESHPSVTADQQARVDNPPVDDDKSHIYAFLRMYKEAGIEVVYHGIDTREKDHDTEEFIAESVREATNDLIRETTDDMIRESMRDQD